MPYCPHCSYDLAGHAPGRRGTTCPECGRAVPRPARRPLPAPRTGWIALGVVAALPLLLVVPVGERLLAMLVGACAVQIALCVVAWLQRARHGLPNTARTMSLCIATAAGVMPLATLVLFTIVFVVGQSSNVAQMAGDQGFDYWGLWFDAWPILLLGSFGSMIAAVIPIALPPYRARFVAAWALPLAALVAAFAATAIAARYFPDA